MTVAAYILIQAEVGSSSDVAQAAKDVNGVESNNMDELGKKIVSDIQKIPGITRTLTCPVVNI